MRLPLVICALSIGIADVLERRVPNKMALAVWLTGLSGALSVSPGAFVLGLMSSAAALALGCVPYAFRLLGGGDVKAFAAMASFLAPAEVLGAAVTTSLLGGVLAVWAFHRRLTGDLDHRSTEVTLPYTVAIGAACCSASLVKI